MRNTLLVKQGRLRRPDGLGTQSGGPTYGQALLWIVALLLLPVLATLSASATSTEEGADEFVAALRRSSGFILGQLVADQVVVQGLQPALDDVYTSWRQHVEETQDMYTKMVGLGLQQLFQAYAQEYHPGIDPLEFTLNFDEFGGDWVDEYAPQWDDLWYHIVREHSESWDEEFGPDWDIDEIEAIYFAMYLASLEWEEEWDDDYEDAWYDEEWDDYEDAWYNDDDPISPREMAMLEDIAGLLELYRQRQDEAGFVQHASQIYNEYAASDDAWRETVIMAIADHLWLPTNEIQLTDAWELVIPGHVLVDWLLAEGLELDENVQIVRTDTSLEIPVGYAFSEERSLLILHWQQDETGWKVHAANADWSRQLHGALNDLTSWIGY